MPEVLEDFLGIPKTSLICTVPPFCNYRHFFSKRHHLLISFQLPAMPFFEGKDDNLTIITRTFFSFRHNAEGGAIFVAGTFLLPRFFVFFFK